ncbi:hypothetical protein [Gordonia humi]|uniref:Uncharacterized protein n=1 Tax=Gordonia humi TaxID=686429 RepID=A0A840EX52_9ACTN|nr:hypothetical protein [Gordonia humi]MBB4136242.1 hypothetical protein [Gordonia humi]
MLIVTVCVGCAQAPGGVVGELVTSTDTARSGVLTARGAISQWQRGRLPRTVAAVAVDDALSTTYDALGVIIVLDVPTDADERARIDVQQHLSAAVSGVVRARRVLHGDADSEAVRDAANALDRIGADLDTTSERLTR